MDALLPFIWLPVVLSLTGGVNGGLDLTTFNSLKNEKMKKQTCSNCKVTQKVGDLTVPSGKKVTLKCSFDGISAKNITWLKDGKRINESRRVTKKFNKNGSRLRIKRVSARDKGLYSCVGISILGLVITSKGYLNVTRAKRYSTLRSRKKLTTSSRITPKPAKSYTGKCEMYRGKVCSPYVTDGTYIYVDTQKTTSSQDFIEKKLSVGFIEMNKLLSNSCKSYSLPFLCHYHFPECSMGRTPKMICKNECELVKTKYCKTEYKLAGIGHSNSSEDDLFPDCNTLPKGTGRTNCISLGRHFPPPQIQSGSLDSTKSGHCDIYRGDLCKKRKVFIPMGSRQVDIEEDLSKTLQSIRSNGFITKQCSPYVVPILCQVRFPDCDETSSSPKGKPICKDECQVLKDRYCKKEHSANLLSISFDCSSVPEYNRSSGKCAEVGVPEKDLMKGSSVISPDININPTTTPRVGMCTPYFGTICKDFIDTKKNIFVDLVNAQKNIETKLSTAIKSINSFPKLSKKCKPFVLPFMCHHLFPYCDSASESTQPKPSYICRRDCLHIQHNFCPEEYEIAEKEALTGSILFPRCLALSKSSKGCISLRKLFSPNNTGPIPGDCYTDKGGNYRGYVNTTESGLTCQKWNSVKPHPHRLTGIEYPELGNHNFCRNPGGKRNKPWCYTTDPQQPFEMCVIPKCVDAPLNGSGEDYLGTVNRTADGKICEPWDKHEPELNWAHNYCRNPNGNNKRAPWCYVGKDSWELCDVPRLSKRSYPGKNRHLKNLLYTIIPCVVFGLVVGMVIIAVCWKHHKQSPDFMKKTTLPTITVFLPELKTIPAEDILLSKCISNGWFGALYNGEIHSKEDGTRVTRLVKVASKEFREEFINQAKKWSQFHHPNILMMEAISSVENPVILVLEYAAHGSLYQYLIHHSPNNPNFTRDHALLTKANLLDISKQIAAGMTYLSSRGYVHGDLMTRNCMVAHSMVIKITDFSTNRDTCYYRRPNKRPTPLGWMAPEAIKTEVFTIYSDVWAFGVVLWEIFTYGFQPYFGYTFPEVKKMVLDIELLQPPRDCYPFVYDLMLECWNPIPIQRPRFFDLHEALSNFSDEIFEGLNSSEDDDDVHSYVGASSC